MARPNVPSAVKINGVDEAPAMFTHNMSGSVTASAMLTDPDNGSDVRLVVRYSANSRFSSYAQVHGAYVVEGHRGSAILTGLAHNTLYYYRCYTRDRAGHWSANYNGGSFWTNRAPNPPGLVSPADNANQLTTAPIAFDWTYSDPDGNASNGFDIVYRRSATAEVPAGPWSHATSYATVTSATAYTFPANVLKASTTYDWMVRSRDSLGLWGPWSLVRSFNMVGPNKPPLLIRPSAEIGIPVDADYTFEWQFRDPTAGTWQGNADFRYRVIGAPTWVTISGASLTDEFMTFPANTFLTGYRYEWQVRTYRATGTDTLSDWSASGHFWGILTPGSLADVQFPLGDGVQGSLGCGEYRIEVFQRGGLIPRGEITSMSALTWGRQRDEISTATITVTGFDQDCGVLLGSLRTWAYEIAIYRNEERVWEGPITRLTYTKDQVTIDAKDVMAYLYRRILRQGYNDSYHVVNGVQTGLHTVVERAGLITVNCLGYDDPNVLPYMTLINSGNDARQSRVVPDYTKTAWEEIDDLAANAGLDYTTVGRRITYWDTHNYLGVLPEMRDGDFSEPPVVSEYGMLAANYFAVTDGQGSWGAAIPLSRTSDNWTEFYGPLEQLASGYGDAIAGDPATMTPAQLAAIQATLAAQAQRNINGRWPAPLVARVPDNATINPDVNVGINQLVPGVWIPLRVDGTVRKFAQMQKLDSVTVEVASGGEKVNVVMSPAPASYEDPDGTSGGTGTEEVP